MNSYRPAALRVYAGLLLQGLSQTISFLYQSNYDLNPKMHLRIISLTASSEWKTHWIAAKIG